MDQYASKSLPQDYPETWAPVHGFEGLYEVSTIGHVRSLHRQTRRRDNGSFYTVNERIMRPCPLKKGHLHLVLRRDYRFFTVRVHVLVLEAFVCPRPKGLHACHCNGIPDDNRLSNLRWDTPKANIGDCKIHGTGNQGFRNPRSFLTPAQIVAIRSAPGSTKEVAKAFGVSDETARRIRKGLRWADVVAA
jgi:hypothetical protein